MSSGSTFPSSRPSKPCLIISSTLTSDQRRQARRSRAGMPDYAGLKVEIWMENEERERCRNAERWFWAAGPWELCFEACRYLQASAAVAISCLLRISETHTAKVSAKLSKCPNMFTVLTLYSHCTYWPQEGRWFSPKCRDVLQRVTSPAQSHARRPEFSRSCCLFATTPTWRKRLQKDKKKPGGKSLQKNLSHVRLQDISCLQTEEIEFMLSTQRWRRSKAFPKVCLCSHLWNKQPNNA